MKRPEQAIKWLTDKGVLSNTRKDLLDYITKLEADSKRLDSAVWEVLKFQDFLIGKGQSVDSNLIVWLHKLLDIMRPDWQESREEPHE